MNDGAASDDERGAALSVGPIELVAAPSSAFCSSPASRIAEVRSRLSISSSCEWESQRIFSGSTSVTALNNKTRGLGYVLCAHVLV